MTSPYVAYTHPDGFGLAYRRPCDKGCHLKSDILFPTAMLRSLILGPHLRVRRLCKGLMRFILISYPSFLL